ncbi:ASC1-like protein 3 [Asparagus officinalis]|uniref:ASC1-like protein 3 n=1 Tax=Asparagus officinalis TaxID=4686 RepID=UPI00098E1072|nr:ASC1-like protein 3 [Asparagus officinalis]
MEVGGVGLPKESNFWLVAVFALSFGIVRLLLDALLYKPLSNIMLRHANAGKVATDDAKQSKIIKCSESMWKFTYYASMQLWVILIMLNQTWSLNTEDYFQGWPNQEMDLAVKLFYMCQCGFYVYGIAALLTWETRRKDFAIMMSHHIITSSLVGFSYITRFFRIGTIILALHDTSDVFLEAAKLFKYSGIEMGASLFFGFFAVSWLILRLVFFPFWIIPASSYQSIKSFRMLKPFPLALYYAFNTMLLTLLVFHMYWWKLICAMIMKQMCNKGKVGGDIRSDSEDDD